MRKKLTTSKCKQLLKSAGIIGRVDYDVRCLVLIVYLVFVSIRQD